VVKQSGAELTGDEVMEFVAGQVAPYKKVRQVEFIDAIPKSASGKILRKDLRTNKTMNCGSRTDSNLPTHV
jgi:acyl-coenzyme A synthetase/AMP-(fatty) acid ligase